MKLISSLHAMDDDRGSAAVEFAIVGPIFLSLAVGMIYVCMLLFSMASMQYAVEEGARCSSVKTTICTNSASTITYAQNAYYGPLSAPTFTYATPACGHRVSASSSFAFKTGLTTLTVPLTATSCFP